MRFTPDVFAQIEVVQTYTILRSDKITFRGKVPGLICMENDSDSSRMPTLEGKVE